MPTVANSEQAAAWDGPEGDHWAAQADRYDAAGRRHRAHFMRAGLISPGDDVLDIGCGNGAFTRDVARQAAPGSVLGVDLSARMLERARERSAAEHVTNVRFEQGDAQVHPFDAGAFDKVVSSFGAMFFDDPDAAYANIGRAMRSDARLAVLTWRELARNKWLVALRQALAVGRALPEPPTDGVSAFQLAEPARVERILGGAGFADVTLQPVDELIELGGDAEDAFSFVRTMGIVRGLTQDLDDTSKERALDQLRVTLAAHETDDGVLFESSAWLITARRR